MHANGVVSTPTTLSKELPALTLRAKLVAVLACLVPLLSGYGFGQTMSTFPGLNTIQDKINSTAAPDPTIAVGTLEYCEHVNSGYQCWYKSGVNANQPVKFLGNTNVKSDAGPWSQNSNNSGNTPHYPAPTYQAMWITYDLQDINNADNINAVLVCAIDLAGLRASTSNPWVNKSKAPACTVAHPLTTYNQRRSWVPANNSDTTPPIAADGEMFTYLIEPPKDGVSYLTDPAHTQAVEQWTINWSASTPTPTFVSSWDLPSTQAGGDQLGCFISGNYYDTVCVPQPSTAA